MPSIRCVILKCKLTKNLFGKEKTTTWQQRVLELNKHSLRWFATEAATVPQNEILVSNVKACAVYQCTDNPWVG